MSPEKGHDLGEPIPMEPIGKPASPTPLSPLKPLKPLGPLEPDDDAPISMEAIEDDAPSKIRTFESASTLKASTRSTLKRATNLTGQGATRVRTFHTKLTDGAFAFLDNQINEWVDENQDVEVKFCNTTIGVVEGKRSEPHIIMTVWY